MYKVFHNQRIIFLTARTENTDNFLYSIYIDDEKLKKASVNQVVNLIFSEEYLNENVLVQVEQIEKFWKKFKACFKFIKAAGGVVRNKSGKLLIISRLEKWDLPKGKIEADELPCDAAIREVSEETGLTALDIKVFLGKTYHCYPLKNKMALKETFWFEMYHHDEIEEPVPQVVENIVAVKWVGKDDMEMVLKSTYLTLIELFQNVKF
jgi:8-oxo-dGTP pyrophosphatase MutT (NUDIX family)